MFRPTISTSETSHIKDVERAFRELSNLDVLVGVPEAKSDRKDDVEINNAELVYIHTNGSPVNNIPPRPIIEPAIEDRENKEKITEHLGEAAQSVLDGNTKQAKEKLNEAGTSAQNAARDWFTNSKNNWPQLAEVTIEARARRKYKISRYKRKETKENYRQKLAEYIQTGVFNPLIDTDEMRKSIIYVIRKKDDSNA